MSDSSSTYSGKATSYSAIKKELEKEKKYVDTNQHIADKAYLGFVKDYLTNDDGLVDYTRLNSLAKEKHDEIADYFENKLIEEYQKVDENFNVHNMKDKSGKEALLKHYFGISGSEIRNNFPVNPEMFTKNNYFRLTENHKIRSAQNRYQQSIDYHVGLKPTDDLVQDIKNNILEPNLPESHTIDDKLLSDKQYLLNTILSHHEGELSADRLRNMPYVNPVASFSEDKKGESKEKEK